MYSVFSIVLATALALSVTNHTLTTAREIRSASVADCKARRPAEVTGVITHVGLKDNFILHDETGGIRIHYYHKLPREPRTGDVVKAEGTLAIDKLQCVRFHASRISAVGQAPVPEPAEASPSDILSGDLNYSEVVVHGTIIDIFADDIDPNCDQLLLYADNHSVNVDVRRAERPSDLTKLIGAEVVVKGLCVPHLGYRIFADPGVSSSYANITVLSAAKSNPPDTSPLRISYHASPSTFTTMARTSVSGVVLAVYRGNRFLLRTPHDQIVGVELAAGLEHPDYNDCVRVSGFPTTDMFHVNLTNAEWVPDNDSPVSQVSSPAPQAVTADELMTDGHGRTEFKITLHGTPVRLRGEIITSPGEAGNRGELLMRDGRQTIAVDIGALPKSLARPPVGSRVEVTGICLMETDSWRPNAPFPRIRRPLVVARTPDDIRVLSTPPWRTPSRLLAVILALCACLLAILVWNRALKRLVDRRSRALLRERAARDAAKVKFEERTRLAVELHDTISQSLTGVSLEIDAAQMAVECEPAAVARHLASVSAKMKNCRENLRQCLWDLRSRAYEEHDLSSAINRAVAPLLGPTALRLASSVRTRNLSDNTMHHILCIVRELTANAIRHGQCSKIDIVASLSPHGLGLSVTDDGRGFDPRTSPGTRQGHFGLQGVSERVRKLGGDISISSEIGKGTTVSISRINPES